jgi:hypothetical protein
MSTAAGGGVILTIGRVLWALLFTYLVLAFTDLGPAIERRWRDRRTWRWKIIPNRSANGVQDWHAPPLMSRFHLGRFVYRVAGKVRGFEIGIHRIMRSDNMLLGLHTHPWNFWSLVFWGWYTEKYVYDVPYDPRGPSPVLRCYRNRRRGWLSTSYHPATYTHALTGCGGFFGTKSCWTLVITGPRVQSWGFPEKGIIVE